MKMSRPATKTEIANYEYIEKMTEDYSDIDFANFIEVVDSYFFDGDRSAYMKLYRLAKKWNTNVDAIVDWYFTEEA